MSIALTPPDDEMKMMSYMSRKAFESKFYEDFGGESAVFTIMLLAKELDIPPMQALSGGIWNIRGKVEMSARMMNMKIRKAGHRIEVVECTRNTCTLKGVRVDPVTKKEEVYPLTFTIKDADAAGYLKKGGSWLNVPDDMLYKTCVTKIARRLFPDVIGNCYMEGEIKGDLSCDLHAKLEPSSGKEKAETILLEAIEQSEKVEPKRKTKTSAPLANKVPIEYESVEIEELSTSINDHAPNMYNVDKENCINPHQAITILELIGTNTERLPKLLKNYKINELDELPAVHFNDVVAILNIKE